MSRLSRQEMKRDEVREWMVFSLDWIAAHGRLLIGGLVGLVVLAIVAVLVLALLGRRSERGQGELADALAVLGAPINAEGADPEHPDNPSFPSEEARRSRAKTLLEDLREEFSGSRAANIAGIYLGEVAAYEGDHERARELWGTFLAKEGDHALAAAARLNLISLERAHGDQEALVAELRQAIDSASGPVPTDLLLYQLGSLLEERGEEIEARDAFQQLVDEYPNSPYTAQARQRLEQAA